MYIDFQIKYRPFFTYDGFTLKSDLFLAVKLTKDPDPDKYSYSGHGISLDVRGNFSLLGGRFGKIVIIFGADMS